MKIFVIESLRTNDVTTGTNLYNDLISRKLNGNNCKLYTPQCKSDLDANLTDILSTTNVNDTIFIHFEMHGCNNGLEIRNDFYCYTALCEQLREINKKCICGLYVTFAVCEGLFVMLEKDGFLGKPMPYCGIVASEKPIYNGEIEEFFSTLYSNIIDYNDLEVAFSQTKEQTSCCASMRFIKPHELFCRAWHNYLGSGQRKDIEENLTNLLSKMYGHSPYEAQDKAKNIMESVIQNVYEEKKKIYYMLDSDSIDEKKQIQKFDIKDSYKDIQNYEITN